MSFFFINVHCIKTSFWLVLPLSISINIRAEVFVVV